MRPDELVEKAQMRGRLQMLPFAAWFTVLHVVTDNPAWAKPRRSRSWAYR